MKTNTIDLKSFCFGAMTMGAVLLMANKPASQPVAQPQPCEDNRRYQAVGVDKYALILDTKTGRFMYEYPTKPRWRTEEFETVLEAEQRKKSN
ncbi:hypothetical protein [Fibrivirga algicola]|uniref:Secreted protein n=1 Tax=Fibrivirga algicola TaxID=2950420 RepID=A0ABX0QFF9_9BACT|nr:hypothetical protein [Fibrivirga algicola]NID09722.1 hypothetical protein [Fibrivirga algicola]